MKHIGAKMEKQKDDTILFSANKTKLLTHADRLEVQLKELRSQFIELGQQFDDLAKSYKSMSLWDRIFNWPY